MNNDIFILTIKSFLLDEKLPQLFDGVSEGQLVTLYNTASKYDVIPAVYFALNKNGVNLPQKLKSLFEEKSLQAYIRNENLDYEMQNISAAFLSEKIDFIFLKGAVVKTFYREPYYRTCSDIDVLIRQKDLLKAQECLKKKLKYKYHEGNGHDVTFITLGGIGVELHYTLFEKGTYRENFLNVFSTAEKTDCGYKMSAEDFYAYHIAHMCYHFSGGSLGFRPFMDLYLIEKNMTFDRAVFYGMLEKCNLKKFYECAKNLAFYWFEKKDAGENELIMQDFIFSGGVFGNGDLRFAMKTKKYGGKKKFLFKRIFLSFSELKTFYPSLNKYKFLYPFFQIRRWFSFIFKKEKRKILRQQVKGVKNGNSSSAALTEFCAKLGL